MNELEGPKREENMLLLNSSLKVARGKITKALARAGISSQTS